VVSSSLQRGKIFKRLSLAYIPMLIFMGSLQLFNPDNALFVQSAEGAALQPNPHSHINADHLSYFHFAGRVIGAAIIITPSRPIRLLPSNMRLLCAGMALFHEEVVEVSFTRGFYKHLLGHPLELDDLLSLDPEFHKCVNRISIWKDPAYVYTAAEILNGYWRTTLKRPILSSLSKQMQTILDWYIYPVGQVNKILHSPLCLG